MFSFSSPKKKNMFSFYFHLYFKQKLSHISLLYVWTVILVLFGRREVVAEIWVSKGSTFILILTFSLGSFDFGRPDGTIAILG